MIETCLKCGYVNKASAGDDSEACPQCGAVYSKVELAMAAKRTTQARERGKNFWTYAVLSGLLLVLVPLTFYEHTWGSSAKRRQSEASLNLALTEQRIQEREAIAKAKRAGIDQAVSQGRVVVGMSAADVQAAWGKPSSINRTVTGAGSIEQWAYHLAGLKTNYVYLADGIVRSFQVSE